MAYDPASSRLAGQQAFWPHDCTQYPHVARERFGEKSQRRQNGLLHPRSSGKNNGLEHYHGWEAHRCGRSLPPSSHILGQQMTSKFCKTVFQDTSFQLLNYGMESRDGFNLH